MKTISELLKSVNSYPIPANVIEEAAIKHGLELDAEATPEAIQGKPYELAKADVYAFLAVAPNVTQNSVSFSFTADQREYFLSLSAGIRDKWGYTGAGSGQGYGYMGEDY